MFKNSSQYVKYYDTMREKLNIVRSTKTFLLFGFFGGKG